MECKCGASTGPARAVNTKKKIELEYQVCKSCGMVGVEVLYINGDAKLFGIEARNEYNNLIENT